MFALRLLSRILPVMLLPAMLSAQEAVPQDRYLISPHVDFYGADLAPLFNTTREACERSCSAEQSCVAYTFNQRNGSCFPKSALSERQPYEGAISGVRARTAEHVKTLAAQRAAELSFMKPGDFDAARRMVAENAEAASPVEEELGAYIAAMDRAVQQGNNGSAMSWARKAVALSDYGHLWGQMAWMALRENGDMSRSDRNRWRNASVSLSLSAYVRAEDRGAQVTALETMARALEENGRGRDAVSALRLAVTLEPREELQAALDKAVAKFGFRITDHSVDSDGAAPRICATFSEDLIKVGQDYEPFVHVAEGGLVPQAEGSQLCLEGAEHGKRYAVTFRQGLPGASGEVLYKDVKLQLYVRDRSPAARFAGRAYVLPRGADAALPIETVNVSALELTLRRVSDRNLLRAIQDDYFGRPLAKYQEDNFASDIAQTVWEGTAEVGNELNADMTTRLPMGEALLDQPPGIYTLSAKVPGADPYDDPAALQWFVLTDLGLSSWKAVDGLLVAVRGLGDAGPREGVTLSLISRANAVLGKATTGPEGFAQFPAGLIRGEGASAPALLVAESGEEDMAFLPLADAAFDLSDRGVEGRAPSPPIDTFVTTDRGVYHAGDMVHVTALTRDGKAAAVEGLPLTAVLSRPDGAEYSRSLSQASQAGGHVFSLPLGKDVPRGVWRLDVMGDPKAPALASQTVLVEDFLPERIDFELSLPEAPLRLTDTPPLTVEARYLFGAPGADLAIEGSVRLRAQREVAGWAGYAFGRHDARFDTRSNAVDAGRTDAQGKATLALELPQIDGPAAVPLEAEVILRVSEGSGRPVERRLVKPLSFDAPMIGIKPMFDGTLPEGMEAGFSIAALGRDGAPVAMPVRWSLNKVNRRYQWYNLHGNWEWEPITTRERVANGVLALGDAPGTLSLPTQWGEYELIVEREGGSYIGSSVAFSSGWYGGDGSSDTPDRLEMSLDAPSYAPGARAQLRLVAEADGVALLSVLSNRVIDKRVVAVRAGENLIDLEVTEEWGTGAYVTASVLRPMDVSAGLNPARALGLAHAAVAPGARRLEVSIDAPAQVNGQRGSFEAALQVAGLQAGQKAYVTLAAVDLGILNLTGFEAPDAAGHYFGQRRLGVELRDVYGRLINGMNGAQGIVRSGGDAGRGADLSAPPPTEEVMVFFSGLVELGADGRATITVERPPFNGTMRLMAVAWTDQAVGNAAKDVVASDPVVVTASLPRFIAPGDQSRLLLELVHSTGPSGEMALQIGTSEGAVLGGAPEAVSLAEGGSQRISLPLSAEVVGDHEITVQLTTPDGTVLRKDLVIPVRINDPAVAVTRQFALGAGEVFTFDSEVFAGMRRGTGQATLAAGPLARLDVPGLLQRLDRYPYGCTEQVTSAAMPLLYLSSMAQGAGLGTPEALADRIDSAIERVLTRQSSNGSFGLWSAQSGDFWLDAYVTDFLSRARAEGHVVPDRAFALAMDNLRNRISYAPDFDKGGEDLTYALLVLAREGAANMGDLRYYADTKAEALSTPLAAAQLGAGLAAYGDPARADRMFAQSVRMLSANTQDKGWRDDYGSALRDAAAVLKLSAEARSAVVDQAVLSNWIGQGKRFVSTQEAAQIALAAHALAVPGAGSSLFVDGAPAAGPVIERLSDAQAAPVRIENSGGAPVDVTMTTFGVPEVSPGSEGYGYALTRKIFTLEGAPVSGAVASGTRMVVVLEVESFEDLGARLVIDDPLPAGFEIDNPNLLRAGDLSDLEWLKPAEVEDAQFRSDRFIAAVNQRGAGKLQLAYLVRAVTPGQYHHPAAKVEDMYRPEYRATTAAGAVTVTE
ncbi:MAG: alpha-2-macroglobulin family protein [Sulfitobacter sp.]